MKTEEWRPIDGFEGLYEVSSLGQVKSLERTIFKNGIPCKKHEKILKGNLNCQNYKMVVLCKDGKKYPISIHRLVAQTFIPNPQNKPVVDHIDTNTLNNSVENLKWVTVKENTMNPLTRFHNSESKKGHPCYFRHTEESRKKLSKSLSGRALSENHKQALSEARKNSELAKNTSKENIKKAQEYNKGKHRPSDVRNKISEKLKGVHKGKKWKVIDGKRVWYKEVIDNAT